MKGWEEGRESGANPIGSEPGAGQSALHPTRAASRVSDFLICVSKKNPTPIRALRNYLRGGGREFWGTVRKGGKKQSRHHVGFVFTHKRKVRSVGFQLSKDLQRASGVRTPRHSAQRLLQLHCAEPTHRNAHARPAAERPSARPPVCRGDALPRPAVLRRPGAQPCRWVLGAAHRSCQPSFRSDLPASPLL